jgi:hypothetical protein
VFFRYAVSILVAGGECGDEMCSPIKRALSKKFREGMQVSKQTSRTLGMLRIVAALVVAILYVVLAGARF